MNLFAAGPYETLERTADHIIAETDVQRLLRWGATPMVPDHQLQRIMEDLQEMPQREGWYGMPVDRILAMKGWPEGLELASRYSASLPSFKMEGIQRRRVWGNEGDEFCRDRFDAGIEECWSSRRRTKAMVRPILKLTCAIGGVARIRAQDLVWMGAAAFALCDAAEGAGYRLEIEAISQTTGTWENDPRGCVQKIKVKSADEPLDRETTVMALACPAWFRWQVIHSRMAICPSLTMDQGSGATREVSRQYHGDLHMTHAYSFEAARLAVGELIGRIEAMAA